MRPWDWLCLTSIIGIWPRWIEPNCLSVTHRNIAIPNLPASLSGLCIALLSDLHLSPFVCDRYLERIIRETHKSAPDLIAFPGDFLSFAAMDPRLPSFLSSLRAPLGIFASLGNHDYAGYPVKDRYGVFDIPKERGHPVKRLLGKLFRRPSAPKAIKVSDRVLDLPPHPDLVKSLRESGLHLLHNETCSIPIGESGLNLTGLGDLWLGRCAPKKAFDNYNLDWPGLVLSHNPNTVGELVDFPGHLILSGHTHGGQINLPIVADKICSMEHSLPKSGWAVCRDKQIVISRGLGAAEPFRPLAPPELPILTLERRP